MTGRETYDPPITLTTAAGTSYALSSFMEVIASRVDRSTTSKAGKHPASLGPGLPAEINILCFPNKLQFARVLGVARLGALIQMKPGMVKIQ